MGLLDSYLFWPVNPMQLLAVACSCLQLLAVACSCLQLLEVACCTILFLFIVGGGCFTVHHCAKQNRRDSPSFKHLSAFFIYCCTLHKSAHTILRCFVIRDSQRSSTASFNLAWVAQENSVTSKTYSPMLFYNMFLLKYTHAYIAFAHILVWRW